MKSEDFRHLARQQALAHNEEYVKALKWMKEPEDIERHKNDKELAVEHPYWRGDKEARDRALAIREGQLRLLEQIMPKRMPRVREAKA